MKLSTYKMSGWMFREGAIFTGRKIKGKVQPFRCVRVLESIDRSDKGLHPMLIVEVELLDATEERAA